jgi:hypothetical protein
MRQRHVPGSYGPPSNRSPALVSGRGQRRSSTASLRNPLNAARCDDEQGPCHRTTHRLSWVTRGARAVPPFKPELVRAAYRTLRRLHPEWGVTALQWRARHQAQDLDEDDRTLSVSPPPRELTVLSALTPSSSRRRSVPSRQDRWANSPNDPDFRVGEVLMGASRSADGSAPAHAVSAITALRDM